MGHDIVARGLKTSPAWRSAGPAAKSDVCEVQALPDGANYQRILVRGQVQQDLLRAPAVSEAEELRRHVAEVEAQMAKAEKPTRNRRRRKRAR